MAYSKKKGGKPKKGGTRKNKKKGGFLNKLRSRRKRSRERRNSLKRLEAQKAMNTYNKPPFFTPRPGLSQNEINRRRRENKNFNNQRRRRAALRQVDPSKRMTQKNIDDFENYKKSLFEKSAAKEAYPAAQYEDPYARRSAVDLSGSVLAPGMINYETAPSSTNNPYGVIKKIKTTKYNPFGNSPNVHHNERTNNPFGAPPPMPPPPFNNKIYSSAPVLREPLPSPPQSPVHVSYNKEIDSKPRKKYF